MRYINRREHKVYKYMHIYLWTIPRPEFLDNALHSFKQKDNWCDSSHPTVPRH